MLSYPLHPPGGIRGHNAQQGETGERQRELPESQRGENTRPSDVFPRGNLVLFSLFFCLHLRCGVSAVHFPEITCQSINVSGTVMSVFVDVVFLSFLSFFSDGGITVQNNYI